MEFKFEATIHNYRDWPNKGRDGRTGETIVLGNGGEIYKFWSDGDLGWDNSYRGKTAVFTAKLFSKKEDNSPLLKIVDFEV